MRTIKFLCYDDENNKMVEVKSIDFTIPFSENLMQFTGLLDKNGKEIYENDIISAPELDGRVYKVRWNDTEFRWGAFSGNGNERVFSDMKNGKIIGNIFQNSDLLN